jgi:predicted SnoaL-like aldol condensation-catalyzing enzyme
MKRMRHLVRSAVLLAAMLSCAPLHAQEAVVGVADAEALFKSPDPTLDANKQVAYHIMKDLLEANHWDQAGQYLTDAYIQHNPNAASGLKGVVFFFTQVLKRQPIPVPEKLSTKIVSVTAEGDLVTVATPREYKDPKDPSKTYTTTWFDMWRFKNGKADEHWDGAMKN